MLLVPMKSFRTGVLVHLIVVTKRVLAALNVVLMIDQIRGIVKQWAGVLVTGTLRLCGLHALFLVWIVMETGSTIANDSDTTKTLDVLIT